MNKFFFFVLLSVMSDFVVILTEYRAVNHFADVTKETFKPICYIYKQSRFNFLQL